jgi:hypothetical protein
MKFAHRLGCVLSRLQTLSRAIAVASRIMHGALPRPDGAGSHLEMVVGLKGEPARMRRWRLSKIAHSTSAVDIIHRSNVPAAGCVSV